MGIRNKKTEIYLDVSILIGFVIAIYAMVKILQMDLKEHDSMILMSSEVDGSEYNITLVKDEFYDSHGNRIIGYIIKK